MNENNNISKWIGVIVILLAVGMNMSAVDSLQVGALLSKHCRLGRTNAPLPVQHACVAVASFVVHSKCLALTS